VAKESKRDELIAILIPHPPVPLCGEEVVRSEAEPGKKREVGGKCFYICPYLSLFYSTIDWQ